MHGPDRYLGQRSSRSLACAAANSRGCSATWARWAASSSHRIVSSALTKMDRMVISSKNTSATWPHPHGPVRLVSYKSTRAHPNAHEQQPTACLARPSSTSRLSALTPTPRPLAPCLSAHRQHHMAPCLSSHRQHHMAPCLSAHRQQHMATCLSAHKQQRLRGRALGHLPRKSPCRCS
jgi:hypothetical protein